MGSRVVGRRVDMEGKWKTSGIDLDLDWSLNEPLFCNSRGNPKALPLQLACISVELRRSSQGRGPWCVNMSLVSTLNTIYPSLALARALKCLEYQTGLKHIIISLIHEPTIYKIYLAIRGRIWSLSDCTESSTQIVLETKERRYFASSKVSFILMSYILTALLVAFVENK